jgi:AmiR/NasT family two-component response regulator
MRAAPHKPGPLATVVADEQPEALERAAELVTAAGHRVAARETELTRVGDAIAQASAELAVVAVHASSAHALRLVEQLNDTASCAVVLLLEDDDLRLVRAALDHGLDAYASRPTADALQSAIDLAQRRFAELHDLGRQVRDLEAGAERRALIERAKGVVMERHDVDERRAYALLRGHARDTRLSLAELAEAVLRSRAVLRGPRRDRGDE